jgi:23S rRNA (uracil1939-C5)-methyltransferase
LKYLSERGYQVKEIQPVDMFPQTTHVETVILMTKCGLVDKK